MKQSRPHHTKNKSSKQSKSNKGAQFSKHKKTFVRSPRAERTGTGKTIEGILMLTVRGNGFVRPLAANKKDDVDIMIDQRDLNTGLNGDTVRATIISSKDRTGRIEQILIRSRAGFAGVLEYKDGKMMVTVSDPKMYKPIEILDSEKHKDDVGKKVFATISSWKSPDHNPEGFIEQVLGDPGENNAEMRAIALERGFGGHFPIDVEAEAELYKKNETEDMAREVAKRKDMRGTTTFTVDPFDAKDFDDALSVKTLSDGNYEIGVHIADVSHYVRPGSALDREAFKRATSVYLVDRTIPMLPEILSNDLCSLKQDVDRLAMSAIFTMNTKGEVLTEWYGKTIIHSNKRFTYEEAQEILDAGKGEYYRELVLLNEIAHKLTKQRFNNGAVSLEQDEVKFKLDDKGTPISVYRKVRQDTNKLIEEFMLLANRKVTEHVGHDKFKGERIFLYRIHDTPEADRLNDLVRFVGILGHDIKMKDGKLLSQDINTLLKKLEGAPERNTVATAIIRAQAKAIYSTNNIGHHGLAFEHYTHFTSPIRRYPDVIVHRLIHDYLAGKTIEKKYWPKYEEVARYSSERERAATDAERASIKYKQVEYMSSRVGEIFDGVITGVTERGMYAEEKETKCEGMIQLRSLGDDFYMYDDKRMLIVGKKTGKTFQIGDPVKIKVAKADMVRKVIDYELVKEA